MRCAESARARPQPLPLLFGAPGSPASTVAPSPAPSPSRDAWLVSSVLPGAGTERGIFVILCLCPHRSRASLISRSPPASFKLPALAPGAPSWAPPPRPPLWFWNRGAHSRPERSPSSDTPPSPAASPPHLSGGACLPGLLTPQSPVLVPSAPAIV